MGTAEYRSRHALLLNPYYKEDMHLKTDLPKVIEVLPGKKREFKISPPQSTFEKLVLPRHRSKNA